MSSVPLYPFCSAGFGLSVVFGSVTTACPKRSTNRRGRREQRAEKEAWNANQGVLREQMKAGKLGPEEKEEKMPEEESKVSSSESGGSRILSFTSPDFGQINFDQAQGDHANMLYGLQGNLAERYAAIDSQAQEEQRTSEWITEQMDAQQEAVLALASNRHTNWQLKMRGELDKAAERLSAVMINKADPGSFDEAARKIEEIQWVADDKKPALALEIYEAVLDEGKPVTAERLRRYIELALPRSVLARADQIRQTMQISKDGVTEEQIAGRRKAVDGFPLQTILNRIKKVPRGGSRRNVMGGQEY